MKYLTTIFMSIMLFWQPFNLANAQSFPAGVVFQNNIAINHHKPEIRVAYRYCHLSTGYCSLPQVSEPIMDKPFYVPKPASSVFTHVVVQSTTVMEPGGVVHEYNLNACKSAIKSNVPQYLNFSMTKGKSQIHCY